MLRSTIAQALEFHLDPDILRQQGNVRFYWIELRLCLSNPHTPAYQKKKDKLLAETNSADQLKTSIIETIISSQFDFLLAMAYKANQDAKFYEPGTRIPGVGYRFKNFLLNMLINMFAERHKIAPTGSVQDEEIPLLLMQENQENSVNYDLQFFVGLKLALSSNGKVYSWPTVKDAIGFHLPKNQINAPSAKIIKGLPIPQSKG